MKFKITHCLLTFFFLSFSYSQSPNQNANGGEFVFNSDKSPCLTTEQRNHIKETLQANEGLLKRENALFASQNRGGGHPLFIWPLRKATESNYNEIYGISGYVDHNPSYPNQLTDYNCGTKSYDTNSGYNHQGIDMFTWPFGWKMMDNDEAEIIAAAPGQIIAKHDGEFDRSCNFNNNIWNAIYVQHFDGSVAWYGHMKNGSLNPKNVGDMVAEGEYLGIVGSSGNSTGPHLHFEVYTDNSYTQLVDPYAGSCNNMNVDSWWQSQRPYINPGVNAVLTHDADPIFPACPTTETTNEENQFDLNQSIHFAIYLKDQIAGTSVNLRLIRPDNTDLYNWNFDLTDNYPASWWRWIFTLDIQGEWKWEATYGGDTVTHAFNVGDPLSVEDNDLSQTSVYPNPFTDHVQIISDKKIVKAKVVDVLGKSVLSIEQFSEGIQSLNLENLSNGLYIIKLESDLKETKTIKLVKE
ncbi:peptidoglycan DD-metalloendopeptidase family protein [Psychroserpens algicola]|uniref:peptidoglycan DD-metalloendopeptidase family protein n=1 Tax=Psychroserpens algicola TaxID=1719034 RepID=UPI0019549D62|nr:peptidoglycan DD-metalloendopeptidase family protein [Psychroserpens algicola]